MGKQSEFLELNECTGTTFFDVTDGAIPSNRKINIANIVSNSLGNPSSKKALSSAVVENEFQLTNTKINAVGRLSLSGTYDRASARLQVPIVNRRRNFELAYNDSSVGDFHRTEQYIGGNLSDTEWVKDINWMRAIDYIDLENLKGGSTKTLSDIENDYNLKIKNTARRSVSQLGDNSATRLQILLEDRISSFMLTYNGETYVYLNNVFTDTEWIKDSNWERITTQVEITRIDNELLRIGKFVTSSSYTRTDARLQVDAKWRKRNFELSYNSLDDGDKNITERYNYGGFTDKDWTNNANWEKIIGQFDLTKVEDKVNLVNRQLVTFTTSAAVTRKKVLLADRNKGFMLAYNDITEIYIGNTFTDTEWEKGSNWQTVASKDYVDGQVTGVYDDVADFNASLGVFPTTGSGSTGYVMRADCYPVTVAGTVGGLTMKVGDILKAKVDNPAQIASNWIVMRNGVAYTPEDLANKNVANGYAGLDAARKLANAVIRTDFRMSQGYIFDGVNQCATVPHNDKLNFGTGDFSIQCVFTASPSSKTERIVQKVGDISPFVGFSLVKGFDNYIIFRVGTLSSSTSIYIGIVTTTKIYRLIATRIAGTIRIYLDGTLAATAIESSIDSVSNTNNMYVGGPGGFVDSFNGSISLLRLFNRGLSQSDITYYENNGRPDLQRLMYADVITNYGELIINGTFDNNSNWYLSAGYSIGNGKLNIVNADINKYASQNAVRGGKRYKYSYTVDSITSGYLMLEDGSSGIANTAGTYTGEVKIRSYNPTIAISTRSNNTTAVVDNISIQQVGCVLELLPQNALPDRWLESQNGLDATTFGSPAINTETPITDMQIVDNITNNIATGVTNIDYTLPAGYIVDSVCVNSSVSLTALQLVNISNSETLLTGKAIASTANKRLLIVADQSSARIDTIIRLNASGNTGLGFNIVINLKRCL